MAIVLAQPAAGFSQAFDFELEPLQGIESLGVLASASSDLEEAGYTSSQLQRDVELRLRTARLNVIPVGDDRLVAQGRPTLDVQVKLSRGAGDLNRAWAYSIQVDLVQSALLARSPVVAPMASTWETSSVGVVDETRLVEAVRTAVARAVQEFVGDVANANPD